VAIVNGIITLDEAKRSIFNEAAVPPSVDQDLEDYISAATPMIESIVGPMVARNETVRFDGGTEAVVLPWPFLSVVAITEDGNAITDYVADPSSGVIYAGTSPRGRDFFPGTRNISVTVAVGPAGATVPPNVRLATRELVRFWWQQGRQGSRPDYGTGDVDIVDTPQGFALPRRVVQLLTPGRMVGGFA
jgi:hypothetical protein